MSSIIRSIYNLFISSDKYSNQNILWYHGSNEQHILLMFYTALMHLWLTAASLVLNSFSLCSRYCSISAWASSFACFRRLFLTARGERQPQHIRERERATHAYTVVQLSGQPYPEHYLNFKTITSIWHRMSQKLKENVGSLLDRQHLQKCRKFILTMH